MCWTVEPSQEASRRGLQAHSGVKGGPEAHGQADAHARKAEVSVRTSLTGHARGWQSPIGPCPDI